MDSAVSSAVLVQGSVSQLSGPGWGGKAEAVDGSHTLNYVWAADPGMKQQMGIQFLRKGLLSSLLGHSLSLWKETSRYHSPALQNEGDR